jgi:stress-induced morphogen
METVQISLQRGGIGSSGVSMMVDIHHHVLKSTTSATGWFIWFVWFVSFIWLNKTNKMNQTDEIDQIDQTNRELPLGLALRYSYSHESGGSMITPDVLTEYLHRMMPDAAVTVSDRTGTMDHLKVVVISAAFAGKNLLDRHRLIYQALDAPMKDGRIHALEVTAKTTDEA